MLHVTELTVEMVQYGIKIYVFTPICIIQIHALITVENHA